MIQSEDVLVSREYVKRDTFRNEKAKTKGLVFEGNGIECIKDVTFGPDNVANANNYKFDKIVQEQKGIKEVKSDFLV